MEKTAKHKRLRGRAAVQGGDEQTIGGKGGNRRAGRGKKMSCGGSLLKTWGNGWTRNGQNGIGSEGLAFCFVVFEGKKNLGVWFVGGKKKKKKKT